LNQLLGSSKPSQTVTKSSQVKRFVTTRHTPNEVDYNTVCLKVEWTSTNNRWSRWEGIHGIHSVYFYFLVEMGTSPYSSGDGNRTESVTGYYKLSLSSIQEIVWNIKDRFVAILSVFISFFLSIFVLYNETITFRMIDPLSKLFSFCLFLL